MKKRHGVLVACCLLLAGAAEYARQWSVFTEQPGEPVYRVELEDAVYRHVLDARLGDLDVVDAEGVPVPAIVQAAALHTSTTRTRTLPWFPLPAGDAPQHQQLDVISERDGDGRVLRIRATSSDTPATAPARSWLIDASGVDSGEAEALELAWEPTDTPLDVRYRVLGSDDLRDWHVVQESTQLMDLAREGRRLLHNRIPLQRRARYLRLQPVGEGSLPALTEVTLHLRESSDTLLQWYRLVADGRQDNAFEYTLDARVPVTHVDIGLDGADAGTWRVESRESSESPWRLRAGPWTVYRLGEADGARSDAPALSGGPVRDRHWRVTASQPQARRPTLELGYRPESVVFVAAGKPPYALVAGSTASHRAASPIQDILAQQRARHGQEWQPAAAHLDAGSERDGARALRPPPGDWKTWLLWVVLALGTLVVGGFAVSLLREKRPAVDLDHD